MLQIKLPCLLCRKGFPAVLHILDRVIANMASMPPGSELDINNITLRLALDMTGESLQGSCSKQTVILWICRMPCLTSHLSGMCCKIDNRSCAMGEVTGSKSLNTLIVA